MFFGLHNKYKYPNMSFVSQQETETKLLPKLLRLGFIFFPPVSVFIIFFLHYVALCWQSSVKTLKQSIYLFLLGKK